jgi:hypothetical protein
MLWVSRISKGPVWASDMDIDVKSKTEETLKIWLLLQNVKLYKYQAKKSSKAILYMLSMMPSA